MDFLSPFWWIDTLTNEVITAFYLVLYNSLSLEEYCRQGCDAISRYTNPVQAWKGSEGSRRLKFLDFTTVGT